MAAIHNVILSFPKGYETQVGERGLKVSVAACPAQVFHILQNVEKRFITMN